MEWITDVGSILGIILSAVSVFALIKTKALGKIGLYIRKESKVEENKKTDEEIHKKLDALAKTFKDYMEEGRQFREETKVAMVAQSDACRQLLANIIEATYYTNKERKTLTMNEFKRIVNAFSIYHNEFEGNSYIAELYNEMMEWEKV